MTMKLAENPISFWHPYLDVSLSLCKLHFKMRIVTNVLTTVSQLKSIHVENDVSDIFKIQFNEEICKVDDDIKEMNSVTRSAIT